MKTGKILLANSSTVGFSYVGPRKGIPVVHHHGWPGSSLEVKLWEEAAEKTGVRLISFDRPAVRNSSPMPEVKTADMWPAVLTQCLGYTMNEFGVLGVSYGSPYALATAATLPRRVTKTVIVAGLGDLSVMDKKLRVSREDRMLMWLGRNIPRLAAFMLNRTLGKISENPDKLFEKIQKQLSPADAALLEDRDLRDMVTDIFSSGLSGGAGGAVRDIALISRPWRFNLNFVECPVVFYHGTKDTNVPAGMSARMSALIKRSKLKIFSNEAHLSLVVNRAEDILKEFV